MNLIRDIISKRHEDRTLIYLVRKMLNAGISRAETEDGMRQNIYYWMREGKLSLRKRPQNNWSVVTEKEAQEIIEAFSPGGEGEWHFNK